MLYFFWFSEGSSQRKIPRFPERERVWLGAQRL